MEPGDCGRSPSCMLFCCILLAIICCILLNCQLVQRTTLHAHIPVPVGDRLLLHVVHAVSLLHAGKLLLSAHHVCVHAHHVLLIQSSQLRLLL